MVPGTETPHEEVAEQDVDAVEGTKTKYVVLLFIFIFILFENYLCIIHKIAETQAAVRTSQQQWRGISLVSWFIMIVSAVV